MHLILGKKANEIAKAFGREAIRTRGLAKGWILKYSTFYIKLYREDFSTDYVAQYYRWNMNLPYKVDVIPSNRINEYAKTIKDR